MTNAAVVGRGLFRCACRAAEGRFHEAAVEALAGLSAPALRGYASTANRVRDAIEAARDLAEPALRAAGESLAQQDAA